MKEMLKEMIEDLVFSLAIWFFIPAAFLFLPYILIALIAWLIISAILAWIEYRRYLINEEIS